MTAMYNLGNLFPQSYKVLKCNNCEKTYEWVVTLVNGLEIGGNVPKCPYCHSKEVEEVTWL